MIKPNVTTPIDTALDMLLHEGRGTIGEAGKVYGVVPALVVAVHDTKGPKRHMMGMVQVWFPWLQPEKDTHRIMPWARVAMPNCGRLTGKMKTETLNYTVIEQQIEQEEVEQEVEKKRKSKHYKIQANFAVGRPRAADLAGTPSPEIYKDTETSHNMVLNTAKQVAADFKAAPEGTTIYVDGLTSVTGSSSGNKALSERRAGLIKRYLVDAGVPESVMRVQGHGETKAGQMRDTENPSAWIDNPQDAKAANCKAKAGDAAATSSADECAACRRVDVTFCHDACKPEMEKKKVKKDKVTFKEVEKSETIEVPDPKPGGCGFYTIPQPGDEVLVGFEQGDFHTPYVLGSLWNGKSPIPKPVTDMDGEKCPGKHPGNPVHETPDLTPTSLAGDKGANKTYFWRSRTGNLAILDDDKGTVRIVDRTGNSVVQLKDGEAQILSKKGDIFIFAKKKIRIDCTKWEVHSKTINYEATNDWHAKADRHITMDVKGKFASKASMKMTVNSKKDITAIAGKGVTIQANTALQLKSGQKDQKFESGMNWSSQSNMETTIGASGKLNFEASSMIKFSSLMEMVFTASGGDVNAKGGMIMLN